MGKGGIISVCVEKTLNVVFLQSLSHAGCRQPNCPQALDSPLRDFRLVAKTVVCTTWRAELSHCIAFNPGASSCHPTVRIGLSRPQTPEYASVVSFNDWPARAEAAPRLMLGLSRLTESTETSLSRPLGRFGYFSSGLKPALLSPSA